VFSPGQYELYSQDSRWCNENQGLWRPLNHGSIVLSNEGGRTCQGGTPYMVLREARGDAAVGFHVMPRGNWVIRASAHTIGGDTLPFAVVELGLADGDLRLRLAPGETFELPEVLIQALPAGEPHLAAPALHRYLLAHEPVSVRSRHAAPVVYNTWFDVFEVLTLPRLRQQLAVAKEAGCEVFTIDAGWYGATEGHWSDQTGDWREKPDAAFRGHMADFAEEVRAAGLGFGIWMEPERIGPHAPVLKEHPDWFIATNGPYHYPDLENPEARAYMLAEFGRLIETYKLAWIKIDFNFELGPDPRSAELSRYYGAWYGLLDELRLRYPQAFFEGCASGAMRADSRTLEHFDGHFLSDTVNPYDCLRIYQGALLRTLPGRWCKWAVLRSVGQTLPRYLAPLDAAPVSVVAPSGALWEPALTVDVDFAARVALCGLFGLSGDIAGLPSEARTRLREHIAFYKQWREFIVGSVAHLLTPPHLKADRAGWAAIQLQHPDEQTHLLFVYRLDDGIERKAFCLRGLDTDVMYTLSRMGESAISPEPHSGAQLMTQGLTVELASRNSATVYVVMVAPAAA
jgi:alpha-galactosidase